MECERHIQFCALEPASSKRVGCDSNVGREAAEDSIFRPIHARNLKFTLTQDVLDRGNASSDRKHAMSARSAVCGEKTRSVTDKVDCVAGTKDTSDNKSSIFTKAMPKNSGWLDSPGKE